MRFEWDETKRTENLRKHGFDFVDAEWNFESETIIDAYARYDYPEHRFYTIRLLQGTVVVLVHTETDEVIRVISLRKATGYEEQIYFSQIRN
jgi:uncharacterized DUF497 family protein